MSDSPERLRWRGPGPDKAAEGGLTAVELLVVLLLVVIACAIAIPAFVTETVKATNTGAQANLETGLAGTTIYWRANKGSFAGVDGGASAVSSITGIDIALKFVDGPSTRPNVLSIADSAQADWLVMTAFVPGTKECWIVVAQARPQRSPVAGNRDRAPGNYFGVINHTTSPRCVAGADLEGTDFKLRHFPR